MTNIRGKENPYPLKIPFDESPKDLHECCNCEGCLCEEYCKEQEETHFGKKEGDIDER